MPARKPNYPIESVYQCGDCPKIFASYSQARTHQVNVHGKNKASRTGVSSRKKKK